MSVQNSACGGTNGLGQKSKELAQSLRFGNARHALLFRFRVAVIGQQSLARAKFILESNQSFVIQVRSPEVNLFDARRFAFLNQVPEKKGHPAQMVELLVRTSILVNDRRSMPQRQQRRDR